MTSHTTWVCMMSKDDISTLVEQHYNDIYKQCRNFFRSWHDTEEAAHSAVLDMLQYRHTIKPSTDIRVWIRSYTRWACIRTWRAKWRSGYYNFTDCMHQVHGERGNLYDLEERCGIDERMKLRVYTDETDITETGVWKVLNEQERVVVYLLDCGLTYGEVATALGKGYNTVRRRIYSARAKLAGRLK